MTRQQKDLFDRIWEQRYAFFAVFMVVMTSTYGILFAIDFIPEAPAEKSDQVIEVVAEEQGPEVVADVSVSPTPVRLIIDKLDRDVEILNPTENSIEALDAALLKGAVRHPDSADLENTGTMFLLGHSSYLPTVHNRNFQAFNGIQNLTWGDVIRIQSNDMEYLYRVNRVYEAKASYAEVDLQWEKPELILATCNSFGSKDDRFVVEASFVSAELLNG